MDDFPFVVVLMLVAVLLWVIASGLHKAQRQHKDVACLERLLAVAKQSGCVFPWFRIVLARPVFMAARLTFRRYEMKGIAVQQPDALRVLAVLPDGKGLIERFVPYDAVALAWEGDIKPDEGSLFWIRAGSGEDVLYVSADPYAYPHQTERVTQDLYLQSAPVDEREVFPMRRKKRWFLLQRWNFGLAWIVGLGLGASFTGDTSGALNGDLHRMIWGTWPLLSFAGALFALALAWFAGLIWANVSARVAASTAVFVAMMVGVVADPVALYLDRKFASEPERIVRYRKLEKGRLEALEPGFPGLRFYDDEYWAQFSRGSEHEFVFQHGALGLWQHKSAGYQARVQAFSDAHPK